MLTRFFGYLSISASAILFAVAAYVAVAPPANPLVFSPTQMLAASWYNYKKAYIEPETFRTIDRQRNDITTSEGQSYTMLRAVWQRDQPTFDGAWRWTRENLSRPDDHLFSWLWGRRADGSFGVLAAGGQNTASDADTDIALALLFAYARWQDPLYLDAARAIITDIWDKEVIVIRGKPYLAANDIEKGSGSDWIVVNPSYFNPAAYHLFASVDDTHSWEALREHSYAVLAESARSPLGSSESAALPPDWMLVNRATGALSAPVTAEKNDTHFGYDALRIPFRIALDAEWFHNPDAVLALRDYSFLSSAWDSQSRLASVYAHDGSVVAADEAPAFYGGTMGYFLANDPENAVRVYREKLLSLYDPNTGTWAVPLSYYDENWAWFGIALFNRQLPNLTRGLPATAFSE